MRITTFNTLDMRVIMKSVPILMKRAKRLQDDIKVLLMNNYRYDEPLSSRLEVISKVSGLQEELAGVLREIREKQAA